MSDGISSYNVVHCIYILLKMGHISIAGVWVCMLKGKVGAMDIELLHFPLEGSGG